MPLLKIRKFFKKYEVQNCNIAVAFSGGTDSTALFYMLLEISHKFNLQISAIHINYHLRGKDSDGDEKFVRELCQKHNIELFVKDADISGNPSKTEETARNIRYEFFSEIRSESQIKFIATAHNANDQAETLLFRLARKSGIAGACGILPIREDGIIRPMLNITRSEILSYLAKNKYDYREDKTNSDVKFSRNRIRANVIPELEKINPAAVLHLAQFCEIMQKQNNSKISDNSNFFVEKTAEISQISELCFENGLILSEKNLEQIENSKNNTGATVLLPNFKMFVLKNSLFFAKNGTKLCEIEEKTIDENSKSFVLSNFWKVEISDKKPQKGENFAVILKDDFPLKVKKLSENLFLKNDTKTAFERMKKAGLSKFERENSPAIFSSNGDLLAVPFVSWKFDGKSEAFRWVRVRDYLLTPNFAE